MAEDPVCSGELDPPESKRFVSLILSPDMEVDEDKAEHTAEYNGKKYYFCAPGCKTLFEDDPEEYLE